MMVQLLLVVFVAFWERTVPSKIPICRCVTTAGNDGFCRLPEDCLGQDQLEPSSCPEHQICCLRGDISQSKCHEYAEFVFSSDTGMTLMANNRNSEKMDTCAIVAVPLIVGGVKVKPKEFPHQAVLGYGDLNDKKTLWECGGSLISERFVLTAAHCVMPNHLPSWVRLGIMHLKEDLDQEQIYRIKNITVHPKYHTVQRVYDIALVELSEDVEFTPYVRPACIDYSGLIEENRAIATGFGLVSHGGEQSTDLLKVTLDILGKDVCFRTVKRQMKEGLQNSQICAGVLAGGKDTCQGDSGGPLQTIKRIPYCMYNIIGLTSYGAMCGFQHSPAVYTRVWSFIPWIETIVWPDQ